jgi:hypothetical protein
MFNRIQRLDLTDRIRVSNVVGVLAPTQPAGTDEVAVSFEYCLVHIDRPWYLDAFISAPTWWIPQVPKGQLTTAGQPGAIATLPIALVAVRNLSIAASWSSEDVAAAANATNFGPFAIGGGVVNGSLSQVGVQVIGWILQNQPPLPPNDPPPALGG